MKLRNISDYRQIITRDQTHAFNTNATARKTLFIRFHCNHRTNARQLTRVQHFRHTTQKTSRIYDARHFRSRDVTYGVIDSLPSVVNSDVLAWSPKSMPFFADRRNSYMTPRSGNSTRCPAAQ